MTSGAGSAIAGALTVGGAAGTVALTLADALEASGVVSTGAARRAAGRAGAAARGAAERATGAGASFAATSVGCGIGAGVAATFDGTGAVFGAGVSATAVCIDFGSVGASPRLAVMPQSRAPAATTTTGTPIRSGRLPDDFLAGVRA
jgi:hypothetical protein